MSREYAITCSDCGFVWQVPAYVGRPESVLLKHMTVTELALYLFDAAVHTDCPRA